MKPAWFISKWNKNTKQENTVSRRKYYLQSCAVHLRGCILSNYCCRAGSELCINVASHVDDINCCCCFAFEVQSPCCSPRSISTSFYNQVKGRAGWVLKGGREGCCVWGGEKTGRMTRVGQGTQMFLRPLRLIRSNLFMTSCREVQQAGLQDVQTDGGGWRGR